MAVSKPIIGINMDYRSARNDAPAFAYLAAGYFDSLSISYPRYPRAVEGRLRFKPEDSGLPPAVAYDLEGMPDDATLLLLDVTHPVAPKALTPTLRDAGKVRIVLTTETKRHVEAILIEDIAPAPAFAPAGKDLLGDGVEGADYLIISHPDFAERVKPLVQQKENEGYLVRVANVLDIYDTFSHGELTPLAIKKFILHALKNWTIPPTYLLLVGDCTGDYRDETRNHLTNYVPAFRQSPEYGDDESWASEQWYSTIFGDDDFADLIVGRISVQNPEDAAEIVRKTVAANNGLPPGPWRNRIVFVGDDQQDFRDACETIRTEETPSDLFVDRVYLSEMKFERNFYLDDATVEEKKLWVSTDATQSILDSFNRGATCVVFFGHGAPNIWSNNRIWFGGDSLNSDNLLLRNGLRMPFVTTMTCNNGAIDYPSPAWHVCISEDMMRVKQGGARSMFVPSGPGATSTHVRLSRELFRSLFHDRIALQGDALALANARYLLTTSRYPDYVRMFLLLGDPSLPFPLPRLKCQIDIGAEFIPQTQRLIQTRIVQAPFDSGYAVFRLEGPEGKRLVESEERRFSPGNVEFSLKLPNDSPSGKWTLKAYLWSEELDSEASGSLEFSVGKACAEIKEFRVDRPVNEDTPTTICLRVSNPSGIPVKGVPVAILERKGTQWSTLATPRFDLQPGAAEEWSMEWRPEFGLHELRAELRSFNQPSDPEKPIETQADLVYANPDPDGPVRFALSPFGIRETFRRLDPVADVELKTPVYLASGRFEGETEIGWGYSDDIETTTTARFAGADCVVSSQAFFSIRIPGEELPKPVFVEVDPDKKITDRDMAPVRTNVTVRADSLPDLTFSTKGVAMDPLDPSDGGTVFFRVGIRNRGKSPARHFRVVAYDDDPTSGGRELECRTGPSYSSLSGLAAGEETHAFIRWDPWGNAGEHKVYFKIDSQNLVLESNEENNLDFLPVRVRTLANLEPVDVALEPLEIKRKPDSDEKEVRFKINATVRNTGETEARNVMFAFFDGKEPDPEKQVGEEALVDKIAPGSTHTETYIWTLPAEYHDKIFNEEGMFQDYPIWGSAQVYLRGSLQRIRVVHRSYVDGD